MSSGFNIEIETTINGRRIRDTIDTRLILADYLRSALNLTGTKVSCDAQVCGACTVLLDGCPVSSCTTLAAELDGREARTIEGLSDGQRLHRVQEAFVAKSALQCGFCTPGMVMTAVALLETNPQPDRCDILEALDGNICRCGTYPSIIEAIQAAAEAEQSPIGNSNDR